MAHNLLIHEDKGAYYLASESADGVRYCGAMPCTARASVGGRCYHMINRTAASPCESGTTMWQRRLGAADDGAVGTGDQSMVTWPSMGLEHKVGCPIFTA